MKTFEGKLVSKSIKVGIVAARFNRLIWWYTPCLSTTRTTRPSSERALTSAGERAVPSARVTPSAKPCRISSVSGVSSVTV